MQQKFSVTNISRDEMTGQVLLRVLSEECPDAKATAEPPSLEDYYLYIFGEIEKT